MKLELTDLPTDSIELMARIRSCMDQVQNLSRASAHYIDMLRGRWSSFCPLRHARSSRMTEGGSSRPGFAAQPRAPPTRATENPVTRRLTPRPPRPKKPQT